MLGAKLRIKLSVGIHYGFLTVTIGQRSFQHSFLYIDRMPSVSVTAYSPTWTFGFAIQWRYLCSINARLDAGIHICSQL